MNNRKQMKAIRQQNQQVQSISLHSNSILQQNNVIQEYADLQFSDQRSYQDSSDQYQGELSVDKLKFLGVDKFPAQYAQKIRDVSETGQGISQYISGHSDGIKVRKNSRKNKQYSLNQPSSFQMDSFLNSRPVMKKKGQQKYKNIDEARQKNNSNSFQHVLQQHTKGKLKRYNIFAQNQKEKNINLRNKYEQQNKQIREFIRKNSKNHYCSKNQSINHEQDSITLITLPQPPQTNLQPNSNDIKYKYKHSRGHSFSKRTDQRQSKVQAQSKLVQLRFQQAKINFMDNFLPDSMKIGNNPYNFLKYVNSKNNNFLRMI